MHQDFATAVIIVHILIVNVLEYKYKHKYLINIQVGMNLMMSLKFAKGHQNKAKKEHSYAVLIRAIMSALQVEMPSFHYNC